MPAPDGVLALAELCERLRAGQAPAQKARLAAGYLQLLSTASHLTTALCLLMSRPFPPTDPRRLRINGRQIRQLAALLLDIDPPLFDDCARAAGEAAEAFALLAAGHARHSQDIPLDVAHALFARLAAARNADARVSLLAEALQHAHPLVCKTLLKAVGGAMRIGMSPSLLEQAASDAVAAPLESIRRAVALCGDLCIAAAAARRNELAGVMPSLFTPVGLMLSTAFGPDEPLPPGDWACEAKHDGLRLQVHVQRQPLLVQLFSGGHENVTANFPEITDALANWPHDAILDCEAVAFSATGTPLPFARLQQRLTRKPPARAVQLEAPVTLFVQDLLLLDGRLLVDEPLAARRRHIADLNWPPPVLAGDLHTLTEPSSAAYETARRRGHDGISLKRLDAPYEPGLRSSMWLLIKRPPCTLLLVVTAAHLGHGRRQNVLSDLTLAVRDDTAPPDSPNKFLNVGKAYTGLTDHDTQRLTERLMQITQKRAGLTRLVEPQVVLEVAFDGVQPSPRHRSGYALRAPRILRWHESKPATDAATLTHVRELFAQALGEQSATTPSRQAANDGAYNR